MFQLEEGSRKFICPRCSQKTFVRYQNERGEYLPFNVGRCDRESKCDYSYTQKQFFIDNPLSEAARAYPRRKRKNHPLTKYGFSDNSQRVLATKPDYIEFKFLQKTLANYDNNSFVRFLFNLFSEDAELVWQAIKNYFIGTTKDGETVFWYVDRKKRICKGKILRFDQTTGKRSIIKSWLKDGETIEQKADSVQNRLKKKGLIKEAFETDKQVFFGEHMLGDGRPAAIAEAEKTAVIASICFPEFVWLAVGSKQSLKVEKLKRLGNRKIILYPDGDGFDKWREVAQEAQKLRLAVNVSSVVESRVASEQKADGYDLADYLIDEQQRINDHNTFTDRYNSALANVLEDENLMREFNRRIEAEITELMRSNQMPEAEAEAEVSRLDNVRGIVLSLTPKNSAHTHTLFTKPRSSK